MATFSVEVKPDAVQATVDSGKIERLLNLTLSEQDYEAIRTTKQDFTVVANFLLEQYARGGVMLPAQRVRYLADLTKVPITCSSDVIEIVENVERRNSPTGSLRVVTDVDPVFASPLETLSQQTGRTVDAIIREVVQLAMTNYWAYGMEITSGTLYMNKETREEMEALVGSDQLTVDGILEWARGVSEKKKQLVTVGKKK